MYEGYAPMQPLVMGDDGPQFKANGLVVTLLNAARHGMQLTLADVDFGAFPSEDGEQLLQLLGLTVEEYIKSSAVRPDSAELTLLRADKMVRMLRRKERIRA